MSTILGGALEELLFRNVAHTTQVIIVWKTEGSVLYMLSWIPEHKVRYKSKKQIEKWNKLKQIL